MLLALWIAPAVAGEVEIIAAKAQRRADGTYRFDVTLKHADTGWKHYADGWRVLSPDGKLLGNRTLLHPHVSEQPFTRSLCCIRVPAGLKRVVIQAHGQKHGTTRKTRTLKLPE